MKRFNGLLLSHTKTVVAGWPPTGEPSGGRGAQLAPGGITALSRFLMLH